MSTTDLTAYRREVLNFLNSLSLKFSPLADALNQTVIAKGVPVDETDPTTWKYYLNLTGQYHSSDTEMYINSVDTQQRILFSPTTLALHPKTAAVYTPGQAPYQALCAQYPSQTDLIKSIVYPVADMATAIAADDFTILAYGTNLLEPDEYDNILQMIMQFLNYVSERWYFDFFSYEPYYTWTFWGLLWQQLIGIVLVARIAAIRTNAVHSWHIWEYLKSYGIGDYSTLLDREQTMFLYRNMRYLLANRGKETNLVILANNLLSSLGVGIYGRDIWQQTQDGAATCQLVPELVPIQIPTKYVNALPAESAETISDMEQRLYAMGAEVNNDPTYVSDVAIQLGTTLLNTMPTKLLEIRALATDRKYAAFLNRFLLDSLVYAISQNIYDAYVSFTEESSNLTFTMTTKDALVLYAYCVAQTTLVTLTNLPTQYVVDTAFSTSPSVPTTLMHNGISYAMHDFTDVAAYLSTYAWPSGTIGSATDFSAVLSTQFEAAINQISFSRLTQDYIASRALRALSQAVTVHEAIALNLSSNTTYSAWFATQNPTLLPLLTGFSSNADPTSLYSNLADVILSNLMPSTPTFARYGNFVLTTQAYDQFKALFVQFCSYNVLFLDTDRTVNTGIFLIKSASDTAVRTISQTTQIPFLDTLELARLAQYTEDAPVVDVKVRSVPEQALSARLTGGIDVSHKRQYGRYHRMRHGLLFTMGPATIVASQSINLTNGQGAALNSTTT